jgi:hypothetical protein
MLYYSLNEHVYTLQITTGSLYANSKATEFE